MGGFDAPSSCDNVNASKHGVANLCWFETMRLTLNLAWVALLPTSSVESMHFAVGLVLLGLFICSPAPQNASDRRSALRALTLLEGWVWQMVVGMVKALASPPTGARVWRYEMPS